MEDLQCPVCFETVTDNDDAAFSCSHFVTGKGACVIHIECAKGLRKAECPTCRAVLTATSKFDMKTIDEHVKEDQSERLQEQEEFARTFQAGMALRQFLSRLRRGNLNLIYVDEAIDDHTISAAQIAQMVGNDPNPFRNGDMRAGAPAEMAPPIDLLDPEQFEDDKDSSEGPPDLVPVVPPPEDDIEWRDELYLQASHYIFEVFGWDDHNGFNREIANNTHAALHSVIPEATCSDIVQVIQSIMT